MTESVSAIEQELLEATVLKLKRKEERQAYLTRLMLATAKLPDPEWEQLSTEAQEWTNGAAEAHKAGAALEDFPDYEEPEDEEVDEEAEEEEAEEEKAPVAAKGNGMKAKPEKQVASPKIQPAQQAGVRKVSACHTIKKMVVKKPTITVSEIAEQLKESGLKVSDVTIATLRSDLRDTLRVLNELKIGEFVL
jgi:hypothetical protein